MPEPKLIYIAGFNIEKNSGRNKATREKTNALSELLGAQNFLLLFPKGSSSRINAYLKVLLFDLVMLARLLTVGKNTVVIQRTTFLPLTNIYLKLRGVQIVYELHTDFKDEIKHYHVGIAEKLILHLYVFAEKLNLLLADKIVYNHPVLEQITRAKNSTRSIYSYNGANTAEFYPMNESTCRKELGLAPDLYYYIFVGSLSKWRGVDLLINIFNGHMGVDDRLLILGNSDHAYGAALKSAASNNPGIIFHDEVTPSLVVKYINAANICLVPVKPILKSPGNPLKLYDYIACGKPVVGQEGVPGCADEIVRYGVGIVTDFYDAKRAAAEMKTFAASHDPAAYLSHNRKIAVESVSWEKRVEKWISFIFGDNFKQT